MRLPHQSWQTALTVNLLAFTVAVAAWLALGPTAPEAMREAGLSPLGADAVRALPILVGAALRVPFGMLADRLGARVAWSAVSILTAAGFFALSAADGPAGLVFGASLLGSAGAGFSVAVQAVAAATPSERRGFALGLLGVGDVGAAVTLALMPAMLAEHGWRAVMRGCAVVVAVTGALYVSAVPRDAPSLGARTLRGMLAPLRYAEGWRLGLAYASTFGVFVALALQGPALLVDAFGCTPGAARITVVIFVATAGLARVPGGVLADRFGARAVLDGALVAMCTALTALALHPTPGTASALLFVAGLASGVGSAAALLLVPRRFPTVTGAAGGVVGALGATLGFALPLLGALLRREMRLTTAALVPMIALAYASLLLDHLAARRREGAALPRRSATTRAGATRRGG
jgi:NNP family nitrate/nitrite transporter-like MFS transporter